MDFSLNKHLGVKHFILFILISFYFIYLSYIISKGLIKSEELSDAVFLILSVISIELSYLLLSNDLINYSFKKIFDRFLLITYLVLLFVLLNNENVLSYSDILLFFLFHFFIFLITYSFIKSNKINIFENDKINLINIVFILSIVLSGIFYQLKYSSTFDFIGVLILSLVFLSFNYLSTKLNQKVDLFLSIILFIIFIKSFVLSSIKDNFHYSWYLGPANSISFNNNLLDNIVSQYGYFNIILINVCSNFFNFDSSNTILLLIISLLILFYLLFFLKIKNILDLSFSTLAIFLGFLIFGSIGYDNLAGATFIPSSSVFRFLPSLILILFFSQLLSREYSFNLKNTFFLYILFFISLIWSFESAFFIIFSLASYLFFLIVVNIKNVSKINIILVNFYINSKLHLLLGFFILIVFYFFLKEKNIFLFYEHALNSSSSLPEEIILNKITLVYLFILFLSYLILRDSYIDKRLFIINILWFSLLTSYSAYFLVRSVDNNIINILPFLIFIICFMKTLSNEVKILRNISLMIMVFYIIISSSYSVVLNKEKFLKNLFSLDFLVSPSYMSENYQPNSVIVKKINQYNNLDLTLISDNTIHKPNIYLPTKGYGLPILPLESFNILSSKTKQYLINDYFKDKQKHLLLCTFDCKFYRNDYENSYYNKIFIGKKLNYKLLVSFETEDIKEYLYLLY